MRKATWRAITPILVNTELPLPTALRDPLKVLSPPRRSAYMTGCSISPVTWRNDVIAFYGDATTVRPLAFAATIKDMKGLLHNG